MTGSWDFLVRPASEHPRSIVHVLGPTIDDLPDDGSNLCCIGAAVYGAKRCTCWEPVYDLDQSPQQEGAAIPLAPTGGCEDCAYRPASPERQGADHVVGNEELLDALVVTGQPFSCHQGIRRVIGWRHPDGRWHPNRHADVSYRPPEAPGVGPRGRPWPLKADGTPADLCAGWAARRWRLITGDTP